MLERVRIHRAMLRLGTFTASKLVDDTAAAHATVRKNLERDRRKGYLDEVERRADGRVGPPEKLYRLTERGCKELSAEADHLRAELHSFLSLPTEDGVEEPATLTAAREVLADLNAEEISRNEFGARLRVAQAALAAAATAETKVRQDATSIQLNRLRDVVAEALHELERLPRDITDSSAFAALKDKTYKNYETALHGSVLAIPGRAQLPIETPPWAHHRVNEPVVWLWGSPGRSAARSGLRPGLSYHAAELVARHMPKNEPFFESFFEQTSAPAYKDILNLRASRFVYFKNEPFFESFFEQTSAPAYKPMQDIQHKLHFLGLAVAGIVKTITGALVLNNIGEALRFYKPSR